MAKDKAQNGFDRIAKMIVKQTNYIKNNKTGADLAVRLGALKTSDGDDLSTTTETIVTKESTFTLESELLIKNDNTSTKAGFIGFGYKGDQYYGYEAVGEQIYGKLAKSVQSYGDEAIGNQYYGYEAVGDIQIGSSAHINGDGKGVLIHGSKETTFEKIIDNTAEWTDITSTFNTTFDWFDNKEKIVSILFNAGGRWHRTSIFSTLSTGEYSFQSISQYIDKFNPVQHIYWRKGKSGPNQDGGGIDRWSGDTFQASFEISSISVLLRN